MEDGRLTLSGRECTVDAWAFEALAARAESSLDPDESLSAAERALALYQGAFLLEEVDAAWTVAARERLRARHAKLVLKVVERWRERGSLDAARSALEHAAATDPTEARFCDELAAEYRRMGRAADAEAARDRHRRTANAHPARE